jgi:hypothetical protein
MTHFLLNTGLFFLEKQLCMYTVRKALKMLTTLNLKKKISKISRFLLYLPSVAHQVTRITTQSQLLQLAVTQA